MRTPTKVFLIAAAALIIGFCLWYFTSGVKGPEATRTIEQQNRSLSDTFTERTPDLSDPEERARFESQVEMIEGTRGN